MEASREIMYSELLAFVTERVYIILYMLLFERRMELSSWLVLSWFAIPNLLYFICFLWRISEKDHAAASPTKREELWWMERVVFWIERVLLVIIMKFSVADNVLKTLASFMFTVSSLIYIDCFVTKLKCTRKTRIEQLQKNETEAEDLILKK